MTEQEMIGAYLAGFVVLGVPIFVMLGRAGLSRWWGVLLLLPVLGPWILLMMLAFMRWPAQQGGSRASLASAASSGAAIVALVLIAGWPQQPYAQAEEARCAGTAQGPDAAIAACTRDIDSGQLDNADLSIAYSNRGLNWSKKGQLAAALTDCSKSIELNSNRASAYICRGHVFTAIGRYQEAIADYGQAISLDPARAIAFDGRGMARLHSGEFDGALADFDEALRLVPDSAAFRGHRGNAWLGKGSYAEAIADLDQAIAADATDAKLYADRGGARQALGDIDRARTDYEAALKLDPKNAEIAKALAALSGGGGPVVDFSPQGLARITLLLLVAAAFLFPLWRVLSRSGRSRLEFALLLVPVVNVVYLWFLAFARWPALGGEMSRGGIGRAPAYAVGGVLAVAAAGFGVWLYVPRDTLMSLLPSSVERRSAIPDGFYLVLEDAEITKDTAVLVVPSLKPGEPSLHLARSPLVGGQTIASVSVAADSIGAPSVTIVLSDAGATQMHSATMMHLGRRLAVVVNGTAVAAPVIQSPMHSHLQITGAFSDAQAREIADTLNH